MVMNKWIRYNDIYWVKNIEKVVDAAGFRVPHVRAVKCVSDGVYVKCLMKHRDSKGRSSAVLGAGKFNDAEHVVEFAAFIRGGKVVAK